MTCAEFQEVLPYIIEGGGNADEEEHLKSCQACSGLVSDLKYIAEQARSLVPMVDPSPRVWEGIQSSLEREGLVRPARGMGRFPAPVAVIPRRSATTKYLAAAAALLLVAVGLLMYSGTRKEAATQPVTARSSEVVPVVAALDDDDQQLLQQVADHAPAARAAYADSLATVNAYITDARNAVAKDPADHQARAHLRSAYDQKSMLYQMALARSLR